MKTEYQVHSTSTDLPWLVLVNGLFASYDLWEGCLGKLTEHFQVLCYNSQGQGSAPFIKYEYLLDEHVDVLVDLVDHLGIEKTHLVGISNGGRIALKFASLYPQRSMKVVACDTYDEVTDIMGMKIKSWLRAQEVGDQKHRFDISSPWIFGETFVQNNKDLLSSFRENAAAQNKEAIAGLIRGALSGKVELEKIESPVLYLVGEEDVLTPFSLHERMGHKTKKSVVKKIAGGHASLYEYPENIENFVVPYLIEPSEVSL